MLTPPYWWKGVYLLSHLKLDGAPLPVTARASEKSLAELTGVRKPFALNALKTVALPHLAEREGFEPSPGFTRLTP